MKAILTTIKPKRLFKILNGDISVEPKTNKALASAVKKIIQEYGYAQIYVYCSKDKGNNLHKNRNGWFVNEMDVIFVDGKPIYENYNGKIVCSFKCYEMEEIKTDYAPRDSFFDECRMTPIELFDYIGHSTWYALHISDLNIFDEPKELYEFKTPNKYKQYQNDLKNAYKTDQKIIDRRYYGLTDAIPNSVELTELSEPYYGLTRAPRNFTYIEIEE